jgi:hypothetical protein
MGSGSAGTRRVEEPRRAGLRALFPGYAQWRWRQRERAWVFAGAFASALGVGVLAWGSPLGLAMLALAYAAHVASSADVIRQVAFPGFARGVPALSASLGLGLSCYAPGLFLASTLAWPASRAERPGERFLVNRWAYSADHTPGTGDRIYFRNPNGIGGEVGRVVATAGQELEWLDGQIRIDGRPLSWTPRVRGTAPRELLFTVPEGSLLVAPPAGADASSCGMVMIRREQVEGEAWARYYPIWSRRFVF